MDSNKIQQTLQVVPTKASVRSSDQKFENLEDQATHYAAPIEEKRFSENKTQTKEVKEKSQYRLSNSKENVRPKSIHIQDQLKQSVSLSQKCTKCLQLQSKLHKILAQKQIIEYNLIQITIKSEELKRQLKAIKQLKVDKSQLNYSISSLKQMIKSYEDEDQRLQKFIYQTMNITPKQGSAQKTGSQLAEGIITEFIANWNEVNRQLDALMIISSPEGFVVQKKQNKVQYNYYETIAKLQEIKDNILQLQKAIRLKK